MTDEELRRRLDDLEDTIDDLRRELRPARGPPTLRGFLSLTAEYGIPAAIAGLRANIRALELNQEAIRDRERDQPVRDTAVTALDRVDAAIEDAQRAIERSDVPDPGGAQEVIADARAIQQEIRDLIEGTERRTPPRGHVIPIEVVEEEPIEVAEEEPSVDVDDELETIKDEVEQENEEA